MNKKELIKLLDKYEIEYEITDNTTEVEEGLRLLDEALEKIGIIIPKETQVDNITRKNDPEVPNQTDIDWNKWIIAWKPLPKPYNGDMKGEE